MALIKIKQTKKRWVVSVMSFNTTARIDIKCHISVFYCKHTNNQFLHFRYYYFESRIFFRFLTRLLLFSWRLMDHFLGARPSKIVHGFCFSALVSLDAFLKKRMALTTWKSNVKCWKHSRNFYVRVTVNESWWKIKFTKQQKNSSACFPPVP